MSNPTDPAVAATVKLLNRRARSMIRAMDAVDDGMCADTARAALLECAAILQDCSEQCEMMPLRIDENEDNG